MSIIPSRKTSTSKSTAAYASGRERTPNTTIATAPTRLAAGRFRCTNGSRWTATRRYVRAKMRRPTVMGTRNVERGTRKPERGTRKSERGTLAEAPCRTAPHFCSAFRVPSSAFLDLPIREQDTVGGMWLRVALVRHTQIRPADAVAARDETAERLLVARLAADRHAPDAEPRRGGLRPRDGGVERGEVAGGELEHAHLVLGPALGERGGVPEDDGVQVVVTVQQRRVTQPEVGGEQQLAGEVVPGRQLVREPARRGQGLVRRAPLALRQQRGRRVAARRDVVRQRDGEVRRRKAEPRVEPDVLDGARHGLEPERGDVLLEQPVERGADDGLADPGTLAIGSHGEGAHPALGPRAVRDIEGRDLPGVVAPQQRAGAGVEQRVAPDLGVQVRHPHPHH